MMWISPVLNIRQSSYFQALVGALRLSVAFTAFTVNAKGAAAWQWIW
jgi:hypothetical protein